MGIKKKSLIGETGIRGSLPSEQATVHHKARVSPPALAGDASAMLTVAGKKMALAKLATAKLATAKLSTTKGMKK